MESSQSKIAEKRTYRLKRWAQGLFLIVGVVCVVLGCLLFVDWMALPWQQTIAMRTGAAGLVLMGIYLALSTFLPKVLFDRESVTVKGVFRASTLRRSEVRGRRKFGSGIVLEPKELDARTLTVSNHFDLDEAWFAWVDSLDDLDAEGDDDRE